MWIIIAPSVFYNKPNLIYIFRSKATNSNKFFSVAFYIFTHCLFLLRTILYFGIYPCIILINNDYAEFKTKFNFAETYVIPATDFMTFLLVILFIVMAYKSNDRLTDFFELTKPIHVQNEENVNFYTGYSDHQENLHREDLIPRDHQTDLEVKIVIVGNSKVGKTWLTMRLADNYLPD
jgi:hypothetical protein